MDRLTDSEKLMYDVMGTLANSSMPVVYKDAMITKLILRENHFDGFARETQDIDASWAGISLPSMKQMTEMLNHALVGLRLSAVVKREYGEKMSAGFKIIDEDGDIKLSIDIDMRAALDSRMYEYHNVKFQGVTPDNVISDKISVISTDKVFRRTKDLIDIYALAHCVTVKTDNVRRIWKRENRIIGTFDAFRNRQDELRHSYEKLRRVNTKPEFDLIYIYLTQFLFPFIEEKTNALVWNGSKNGWTNISK
jgi:hypothetical protein